MSAPNSQIAIAAIVLRRGQIIRKFLRKGAIFARNSQNEIAIASDGKSQLLNRNVSLFKSVPKTPAIAGLPWKFAVATIAISAHAGHACRSLL